MFEIHKNNIYIDIFHAQLYLDIVENLSKYNLMVFYKKDLLKLQFLVISFGAIFRSVLFECALQLMKR